MHPCRRATCCFLWASVSNLYANQFLPCHSRCLYVGWYQHSSLPSHMNVKMRRAERNFFIAHMSLPRYWIGPWFSDFNETGTQPRLSHCSEFRWFSFSAHILFSLTQESSLDCFPVMWQNNFIRLKTFLVKDGYRDAKPDLSFFPFRPLRKEIWILWPMPAFHVDPKLNFCSWTALNFSS